MIPILNKYSKLPRKKIQIGFEGMGWYLPLDVSQKFNMARKSARSNAKSRDEIDGGKGEVQGCAYVWRLENLAQTRAGSGI